MTCIFATRVRAAGPNVREAPYNHLLWKGLMGDRPYPTKPTGLDLRHNRAELLRRYYASQAEARGTKAILGGR
jgi:hypothetical protein